MVPVVDAVVSSLIKSVSQILVRETNLILNAREQFESFQVELRFIHEFLRNSAGKRDKVKEVVKQIQDVALEAEDLIDDFVVNMAMHQRRNTLQKFIHGWEQTKLLRNVSVEIKRINNKIKLIHGNQDKYHNIMSNDQSVVPSTEESEKALIQRRRTNVEEDEVVGFNNYEVLVQEKLDTSDSRRDVVSIVGMGGLGKTTLAKKIYNGSFVKRSFDCRAWIAASQDYHPTDLLRKIADSVLGMTETNGLTEEMLVQKLAVGLAEKRYLIVLDDVWDKQLWDGIKAAFPDNGKKSRVLITSRFKEVASHASVRTPPYFMSILNEEDSWKLFSTKVFHGQVCSPRLEQLARQQILTRCKGLPLAIVVAAGLLRNREASMWPNVASGLNWFFSQDPTGCLAILALSYNDMPPHLKPCFLYFGVYPEDFDIPVRQLIRLWVAEGFVDQETNNNLDMEDMAEEYLSQLIDRSLIQVASRRTDGGVKSCRIHDLLRDLSISEGIREEFLVVDTKVDSSSSASNKLIRRLSAHYGSRQVRYDFLSVSTFSRLQSLLCFGDKDNHITYTISVDEDPFSRLSKFCRYLRVLDLGSARCYNFPPKVEKLVQLRYLRMNTLGIPLILPPISKLRNLQTLDLRESYSTNFSGNNICEMQQLRHLLLPKTSNTRFHIPKGNGNSALPNLRTLSCLYFDREEAIDILKMLPNLKKLMVCCGRIKLGVFEHLSKLQHLRTLKIWGQFCWTGAGALPLSLTKITLYRTHVATSALLQLGGLPNLLVLKLRKDSLIGSKIELGSNQGLFPRLEVLHIHELDDIQWWSMEGEGLQSLVYLSIESCEELEAIPDQLKQLTTLRQLRVWNCPALWESLRQIWVDDPRFDVDWTSYW